MVFFRKNLTETIKFPLFFLISALIIFFIYTFTNPIPTDSFISSVGTGAKILDLGDRNFYLDYDSNLRGGFLYPLILKIITMITENFSLGNTSKLWNIIAISLTSLLSILNLFLIDKACWNIFGKRVAKITNWLYVICPYTIFYSISGGLTMYLMLGTSLLTYIVSSSSIFLKEHQSIGFVKTYIYSFFCVLYIASLRPTGAIFGISLITILLITTIIKLRSKKISISRIDFIKIISISFITLLFCIYQILSVKSYLSFSINNFLSEEGLFFGVSRNLLRERLDLENLYSLSLKNTFYLTLWKVSDFVAGISDIRDTHSNLLSRPLFPFLVRVFTGLFFLYPINLFAFASFFSFWRRIRDSGLFVVLISAFISIIPSIVGIAMSRYLMMVYPPIIICASSILSEINNKKISK